MGCRTYEPISDLSYLYMYVIAVVGKCLRQYRRLLRLLFPVSDRGASVLESHAAFLLCLLDPFVFAPPPFF